MVATFSIPMNDSASFSYLVAIRRNSFSFAMHRSTTFRFLYALLLNSPQRLRSFTCSFSRIGITGWTPQRTNPSRITSELYPLSPAKRAGRRLCRQQADPNSGPRTGHSLRLPRVRIACSRFPFPSVSTCSFDPKPPRLNPSAWSAGSCGCDPLFSALRRHAGWRGCWWNRHSTAPNRSSLVRPLPVATPPGFAPRFHRVASPKTAGVQSGRVHSVAASRATQLRCLGSKSRHLPRCDDPSIVRRGGHWQGRNKKVGSIVHPLTRICAFLCTSIQVIQPFMRQSLTLPRSTRGGGKSDAPRFSNR